MYGIFALTTQPISSLPRFAKTMNLQGRGDVAPTFQLTIDEHRAPYYDYNEYPKSEESLAITGSLVCALAVARKVLKVRGCKFVRCGWVLGSAIVLPTKICVTEFASGSSAALARQALRVEYLEQGHSKEEVDEIVASVDKGDYHEFADQENEREVDMRYALQEIWQDHVARAGGYPTEAQLREDRLFAAYFDLGFTLDSMDSAQEAQLETQIGQAEGPARA